MANKILMSGHRGPYVLGYKTLYHSMGPLFCRPQINLIIYIYPIFGPQEPHKYPLSDHKGPLRVQKSPLSGHKTPCKAIRASIGPQEQGHKGPLAGYNGPILSHKSHYRVTRYLFVLHIPSIRTYNRATQTSCQATRLSFGPLGFLIGTPGSLSG